jgi:pimeloyl-ACP methyl ester carboxylesterase
MLHRLLGLLLLLSTPLYAEIVTQEMPGGLVATAEYQAGDADKPLLLFIHAFLQTRNFPTSKRLAEALGEEGYPTLSPTLTLGVSDRRGSLPCESLQLHSIDQEAGEIARWVEWAMRQGHQDIRIIGHSAGSVSIVAYLDQFAGRIPESVRKTVLISLTHYGAGRPAAFETTELEREARQLQQQGSLEPAEFALAFCEKYPARPGDYLSYLHYSAARIRNIIADTPVETHVVLGSKDFRIGKRWIDQLVSNSARVHVIEGANHFFDQSHEFDLLDVIGEIIEAP